MIDESAYEIMEAEEFLELVWGERRGWVDLPAKVGGYWVPFHLLWPSDATVTRRIDTCLRDREDLYYSVAQFAKRGRSIEDVLSSQWLWADLDEVHPSEGARLGFMPTVAIESSPGRYQALWRLDRQLGPGSLDKLNRGLSYALDADRGGWDLTQVLRIPGTRNFKYKGAPVVRLLWYREELVYDPRKVWSAVKDALPQDSVGNAPVHVPRSSIPAKAKALLRVDVANVVEGERSARLWELECLLAESGLDVDSIFELVRGSAWNKWRGSGDNGRRRLRADIQKALAHVTRKKALDSGKERDAVKLEKDRGARVLDRGYLEKGNSGDDSAAVVSGDESEMVRDASAEDDDGVGSLPWIGYSSFMAMVMEEPKWLIEDVWTAGSHGIIGGEPKTSKTTIALALALSVASGSPFLGRYAVGVSGPVLMVQEENAPWMMQDRLRKMAAHAGLISTREAHVRPAERGGLGAQAVDLDFPVDLPLRLLNNFGFDLGVEEHRDMLEAEISITRPVLLILDPLYLILTGDINSADRLQPFLKWLLRLRYEYNMAIAVIHHSGKDTKGLAQAAGARAGQRLLGSTTLHGWCDSALYLSRIEESRRGWIAMNVEPEFRSMAPRDPFTLAVAMGDPGDLSMSVELGSWNIEGLMLDMVRETPGVTVVRLAEALGVDKRTVLSRIRGREDEGLTIVSSARGRGRSHQVFITADMEGANSNGHS